jgi:hypothetical protein
MITSSDLISLPYTPDLSEGGIAYACHWLAGAYERMGDSPAERLRSRSGGAAVELAFRRYLTTQAVPFEVREGTPFSQPEHYTLALGGHRCDIISYLITRPGQLAQLRQDPASLLQAPALIPLEQFAAEGHKPDDLYVFAFLTGKVTASQEDVKIAIAAAQTIHLIHPLPEAWRRPAGWRRLERLALKSDCATNVPVEIGGLNAQREFTVAVYELPPRTRLEVAQEFYSLTYMHAGRLPGARLGLHSPVRGEAYIIQPYEWGDIWIEGKQILLAGWITHEEFRSKAAVLNTGMPTFQFAHTRIKNLLVRAEALNPLGSLMEKVRGWEAGNTINIITNTLC